MELRSLNVLHWRGPGPASVAWRPEPPFAHAFFIDTCQRRVAVLPGTEALEAARSDFQPTARSSILPVAAAYAFLLRCCCGLESKLVAETEIFGQIKQAWRDFSATRIAGWRGSWRPGCSSCFRMPRRSGRSISPTSAAPPTAPRCAGCWVRKRPRGPTLLVGAGQLAQSVGPG